VPKSVYLQAQCIVEQYSSYRLDNIDLAINGKMTQGENIADNGGLKQVRTNLAYTVKKFTRLQDFFLRTPSWDWNWVSYSLAGESLVSDIPPVDWDIAKAFVAV